MLFLFRNLHLNCILICFFYFFHNNLGFLLKNSTKYLVLLIIVSIFIEILIKIILINKNGKIWIKTLQKPIKFNLNDY